MNRRVVRIVLASVYTAAVALIVFAANRGQLGGLPGALHVAPGADKFCHLLLVGGLAFAINLAADCRPWRLGGRAWLPGTVICLPLSVVEELTQIAIPSRNFDPLDMLMNVLGVLLIGPLASQFQRNENTAA